MALSKQKIKNVHKYQLKREKETLRKSLLDKITQINNEIEAETNNSTHIMQSAVNNKIKCNFNREKKKNKKIDQMDSQNNTHEGKFKNSIPNKEIIAQMHEIQKKNFINTNNTEKLNQYHSSQAIKNTKNVVSYENDIKNLQNDIKTNINQKIVLSNRRKTNQDNNSTHFRNFLDNHPIIYQEDEIITKMKLCNTTIITGVTGCGKSTIIPTLLLSYGYTSMVIVQPRRIVCDTIAERINKIYGQIVASVRYRNKSTVNKQTRVQLVTDGILLRDILDDIFLSKYDTVIVDEVHECTSFYALLLPLLMRIMRIRSNLRLILMSATPSSSIFELFPNTPIISINGLQFPVRIHYSNLKIDTSLLNTPNYKTEIQKLEMCIFATVQTLISTCDGSILVFLTSKKQISVVSQKLSAIRPKTRILPLYAGLPTQAQNRIFSKDRFIILATNYAETGITIPSIKHVVDCGLQKICISDGNSVEYKIMPISKDAAEQRRGRVGRTQEGSCHRMYTPEYYQSLTIHTKPAILHSPIHYHLLILFFLKIKKNILMHNIPSENIIKAKNTLKRIKAIRNDRITSLGKALLNFPFSPIIASIAHAHNCDEVRLICAILDTRFDLETEHYNHDQYDNISESIQSHDEFSELFTQVNYILSSPLSPKKDEIISLSAIKTYNLNYSIQLKLKISRYIFNAFRENLCIRVDNNFYFNTIKVFLTDTQLNMNCEYFVFQYIVIRNEKMYPKNITKVQKEWIYEN